MVSGTRPVFDELLAAPTDVWDEEAARGLEGLDAALHRAHAVGADPALTKEGGGNFSTKGEVLDEWGRRTPVLWMSAWGCDGAKSERHDFPALRLDDLRLSRDSGPMSESEMVRFLLSCGLSTEQRRPGIETLTHAFLPAAHVDHTHPDAVIALTSFPGGLRRAEEEFGDEAIWFDYRQFDVDVARELADRVAANPRCRFVLLANHGLFTWGDTSEECYRNSLEAVTRASRALSDALCGPPDLGGAAVDALAPADAEAALLALLPRYRGELGRGGRGTVLHVDRRPEAVDFACSARGPDLTATGPACPDQIVTVGYRPLVSRAAVAERPDEQLATDLAEHERWYGSYYDLLPEARRLLPRRSGLPRAVVLPGLGAVASGVDAARARLCADHLRQTMDVIRVADAAGGYVSISEVQGVTDEYWPLIALKPQLQADAAPLFGRVVLVLDTDTERALAVAARLAVHGAHISVAASDPGAAALAAGELCERHGERRVVAVEPGPGVAALDVAAAATVAAYGGFDLVVDLAGAVAAAPDPFATVFARQGSGAVLTASEASGAAPREPAERLPEGVRVNSVSSRRADVVADAALFFSTHDHWPDATIRFRPTAETRAIAS